MHFLFLKTIFLNGVMRDEYLTLCGCCVDTRHSGVIRLVRLAQEAISHSGHNGCRD